MCWVSVSSSTFFFGFARWGWVFSYGLKGGAVIVPVACLRWGVVTLLTKGWDSWTSESITVYHMPSTIGISHLNDGTVPDVITLTIVNEDAKNDGGLCDVLTGLGSAIAGSVNGAAGGIFSMGNLACKAI